MLEMSHNTQDKNVEKQANSIVLFLVLVINAALSVSAHFVYASSLSKLGGFNFAELYDIVSFNAFYGLGVIYTAVFCMMLIIFILNRINSFIGRKVPLAESIIRILLRLPVNIALVLGALIIAFFTYSKLQVPGSEIIFGPVVIDIALILGLLFLTLFVRKV